jgi:hypothetical protein
LEEEVWGGDGDDLGLREVGDDVSEVLSADDPVLLGKQVEKRDSAGFEVIAHVHAQNSFGAAGEDARVEGSERIGQQSAEFRRGGPTEQERGWIEETEALEREGVHEVAQPARAKPERIADEGGAEDDAEQARRVCCGGHDGQGAGEGFAYDDEGLVFWKGVEDEGEKLAIVFGDVGREGDDDGAQGWREMREQGAEHGAGAVEAGEEDEGAIGHCGSLVWK